jgi:hypothetical protein
MYLRCTAFSSRRPEGRGSSTRPIGRLCSRAAGPVCCLRPGLGTVGERVLARRAGSAAGACAAAPAVCARRHARGRTRPGGLGKLQRYSEARRHAIRKGGVVLPRGVVRVGSEDTEEHGEQRWDDMAEGSGWDALTRRATVHQAQVPVDFWKSPPAYVVTTRGYPHAPAPVLLVVGGARPPPPFFHPPNAM